MGGDCKSPFRKRLSDRVCLVFADFCECAEVLVATGRALHTNAQTQRKYGSEGFVNSRPAFTNPAATDGSTLRRFRGAISVQQ